MPSFVSVNAPCAREHCNSHAGPMTRTLTLSSPGFCVGMVRPLSFVLLCVGFLLVAV